MSSEASKTIYTPFCGTAAGCELMWHTCLSPFPVEVESQGTVVGVAGGLPNHSRAHAAHFEYYEVEKYGDGSVKVDDTSSNRRIMLKIAFIVLLDASVTPLQPFASTLATMSTINLSAQDLSFLYAESYCVTAVCVLLIYDWLLCLGQEVRFIWNLRGSQRVTVSSFVYAFSRYALLIMNVLSVMTIRPMSDLSCKANLWTQVALEILALVTLSTFSSLRAFALSNRSIWFAAIIVLLALPPVVMQIVEQFFHAPENLPSPLNCSSSNTLSPTLSASVIYVNRVPQLAVELLVVGITWWYTYQSYRVRKGVKLGKTVTSLLFYNGSMYFLCLATLYTLDIVLSKQPARDAAQFLEAFIDPIGSILTCRFMLSLRQFDNTVVSMTSSGLDHQLQEYIASAVLPFGAQPSDNLPALIAPFAHPVHVDVSLSETDTDAIREDGYKGREMTLETPSWQEYGP